MAGAQSQAVQGRTMAAARPILLLDERKKLHMPAADSPDYFSPRLAAAGRIFGKN
jgi:hypothetical protein